MDSVIIGALIAGAIIGAIPAICGAIKGKIQLAIIGFVACLVSALILGMILAIPVCAVFLWLIFKKRKITRQSKQLITEKIITSAFCRCDDFFNNISIL